VGQKGEINKCRREFPKRPKSLFDKELQKGQKLISRDIKREINGIIEHS
jgi:hypothetical protein